MNLERLIDKGTSCSIEDLITVGIPDLSHSLQLSIQHHSHCSDSLSEIEEDCRQAVSRLEEETQRKLGDPENPLLLTICRGSRPHLLNSNPMVLNLGINDRVFGAVAGLQGNDQEAWELLSNHVSRFLSVVYCSDPIRLEAITTDFLKRLPRRERKLRSDDGYISLLKDFWQCLARSGYQGYPQDPFSQIKIAVETLFGYPNKDSSVAADHLLRRHGSDRILGVCPLMIGDGIPLAIYQNDPKRRNEAFSYLYHKYSPQLVQQIRVEFHRAGLYGNRANADAEDLFGDIWVAAMKALPFFQWQQKPIGAWLHTTASHLISKFLKKRCRDLRLAEALEKLVGDPGMYTPLQSIIVHEDVSLLHRCIAALQSPDHRSVIELVDLQELNASEVAHKLGWSKSKVYTTRWRALQNLRVLVQKQRRLLKQTSICDLGT